MALVSIRIPQIGEGLQEARLVAVLKQPGDTIRRDEPIYQMETDKAVMDVESPVSGRLVAWLANADDVLPIGAEIAQVESEETVEDTAPPAPTPSAEPVATTDTIVATSARNASIPPRTRAYAKEKGLTEDELVRVTPAGSKLMPEDVDAYLVSKGGNQAYSEHQLSPKQRLLAARLVRGNQLVVPGTMSMVVNWTAMEAKRAAYKAHHGEFQPSVFTMFAYLVAQVIKDHPHFRSSLVGDTTVRTYQHVTLGIAVSLPGDELVLAAVDDADTLDWPTFAHAMRERIHLARQGQDQASERVTISLTNMQAFGLRDAVPVVAPPSIGTLFLGEVYNGLDQHTTELRMIRAANIGLTFDHRVVNGVGAAEFLTAIRHAIENVDQHIPGPG